jgi:hypothetical protein
MRSFAYALGVRRAQAGAASAGPGGAERIALTAFVHLRPGHGRRRIRIAARLPASRSWSPLGESLTDVDGFASLVLTGDPRATFRLEVADGRAWSPRGAPVTGAS